jgi:hypothetical protein
MRRRSTFLAAALMVSSLASAQDTLLYEGFEGDPSGYIIVGAPSGTTNEATWTNFDFDGLPDGSPSNRPGEWYYGTGFSTLDANAGVAISNSWTNNATTPVANYLITPAIQIVDGNAVVSWKSAPYQTPKYLDGYVVLASSTTNDENAFTDTLFVGSEYMAHNNQNDSSFSAFTFSPSNGFVHGMDGTYIEYTGDSLRFVGELRPFTQSLAAYSGGHVYIAFVHYTHDDNLFSIDDILITGTDPSGLKEAPSDVALNVYPNPASASVNISYTLQGESPVFIDVYDMRGALVSTEARGLQANGDYAFTMDLQDLTPGYYNIVVRTAQGKSVKKLMVK